jgi:hypothetical protein
MLLLLFQFKGEPAKHYCSRWWWWLCYWSIRRMVTICDDLLYRNSSHPLSLWKTKLDNYRKVFLVPHLKSDFGAPKLSRVLFLTHLPSVQTPVRHSNFKTRQLTHLFSFFRILWWCSSRLFDIFIGKRQLMLNGKHESSIANRLEAFPLSLKTNSNRESSFETCIHLNAESFCIDSLGVCCVLSIFAVSSSKISRWLLNEAARGFEGRRWLSLKNVIDTRQRTHLIDGWSNSETCRIVSWSFDLDKGS